MTQNKAKKTEEPKPALSERRLERVDAAISKIASPLEFALTVRCEVCGVAASNRCYGGGELPLKLTHSKRIDAGRKLRERAIHAAGMAARDNELAEAARQRAQMKPVDF